MVSQQLRDTLRPQALLQMPLLKTVGQTEGGQQKLHPLVEDWLSEIVVNQWPATTTLYEESWSEGGMYQSNVVATSGGRVPDCLAFCGLLLQAEVSTFDNSKKPLTRVLALDSHPATMAKHLCTDDHSQQNRDGICTACFKLEVAWRVKKVTSASSWRAGVREGDVLAEAMVEGTTLLPASLGFLMVRTYVRTSIQKEQRNCEIAKLRVDAGEERVRATLCLGSRHCGVHFRLTCMYVCMFVVAGTNRKL